jgi:hypothetical protein
MQLTPEERKRIYLEEKARLELRQQNGAMALTPEDRLRIYLEEKARMESRRQIQPKRPEMARFVTPSMEPSAFLHRMNYERGFKRVYAVIGCLWAVLCVIVAIALAVISAGGARIRDLDPTTVKFLVAAIGVPIVGYYLVFRFIPWIAKGVRIAKLFKHPVRVRIRLRVTPLQWPRSSGRVRP